MLFALLAVCMGVREPELCQQLLDLQARDESVRLERLASWRNPAANAQMEIVDGENLACVEGIIREHGWPGESLVGTRASTAAWTIIEHANLGVQRLYAGEMIRAADDRELSWALLATTIDRMLIREGKRQRYGTQFALREGKWLPEPVEDAEHVDERRAAVGLRPLAEYAATMNATYSGRR